MTPSSSAAAFLGQGHRRVHPDHPVEEACDGASLKTAKGGGAQARPDPRPPPPPSTLPALRGRQLTGRVGPRAAAAARFRGFGLQVGDLGW